MTDSQDLPSTDRELTERVRRLARYGAGWDGYTAAPASPAAIEEACAFAAALGLAGTDLQASLEPDGSVDLAAERDGERLVLAFAGDGAVEILRRASGRWDEAGRHALRVDGAVRVPESVRALLAGVPA